MKTRLFVFVLMLGSSMGWSPVWAEQTCDTSVYPLSSPTNRFIDNGDGTLTDIEPDLTWMRCSLGQVWTGKTCTGKPITYTWKSAQEAANKLNHAGGFANHVDWRVPQIRELATIAERQCSNPRINLALFPDTHAVYFWTATTRIGKGMEEFGYALSFGSEGVGHKKKSEMLNVRLVSGGHPK
ncbi:MAG: DUF1566 domain-containing protein [Gallionella sp.]